MGIVLRKRGFLSYIACECAFVRALAILVNLISDTFHDGARAWAQVLPVNIHLPHWSRIHFTRFTQVCIHLARHSAKAWTLWT